MASRASLGAVRLGLGSLGSTGGCGNAFIASGVVAHKKRTAIGQALAIGVTHTHSWIYDCGQGAKQAAAARL